jgi:hypothetical protein
VLKFGFLAIAVMLCTTGQVGANALDDCVLKNMPGVTSDVAAKAIKEACLRKNSVQLDEAELSGLRIVSGGYGPFSFLNVPGFSVEVKNDTGYIVTEITLAISIAGAAAEQFRIDNFDYQEPGTVRTGLVPDPTVLMRIDPGRSRKFQFSADRPEIDKKKKWSWMLVAAKGIVSR